MTSVQHMILPFSKSLIQSTWKHSVIQSFYKINQSLQAYTDRFPGAKKNPKKMKIIFLIDLFRR